MLAEQGVTVDSVEKNDPLEEQEEESIEHDSDNQNDIVPPPSKRRPRPESPIDPRVLPEEKDKDDRDAEEQKRRDERDRRLLETAIPVPEDIDGSENETPEDVDAKKRDEELLATAPTVQSELQRLKDTAEDLIVKNGERKSFEPQLEKAGHRIKEYEQADYRELSNDEILRIADAKRALANVFDQVEDIAQQEELFNKELHSLEAKIDAVTSKESAYIAKRHEAEEAVVDLLDLLDLDHDGKPRRGEIIDKQEKTPTVTEDEVFEDNNVTETNSTVDRDADTIDMTPEELEDQLESVSTLSNKQKAEIERIKDHSKTLATKAKEQATDTLTDDFGLSLINPDTLRINEKSAYQDAKESLTKRDRIVAKLPGSAGKERQEMEARIVEYNATAQRALLDLAESSQKILEKENPEEYSDRDVLPSEMNREVDSEEGKNEETVFVAETEISRKLDEIEFDTLRPKQQDDYLYIKQLLNQRKRIINKLPEANRQSRKEMIENIKDREVDALELLTQLQGSIENTETRKQGETTIDQSDNDLQDPQGTKQEADTSRETISYITFSEIREQGDKAVESLTNRAKKSLLVGGTYIRSVTGKTKEQFSVDRLRKRTGGMLGDLRSKLAKKEPIDEAQLLDFTFSAQDKYRIKKKKAELKRFEDFIKVKRKEEDKLRKRQNSQAEKIRGERVEQEQLLDQAKEMLAVLEQ
jgi:hypothetical protein